MIVHLRRPRRRIEIQGTAADDQRPAHQTVRSDIEWQPPGSKTSCDVGFAPKPASLRTDHAGAMS